MAIETNVEAQGRYPSGEWIDTPDGFLEWVGSLPEEHRAHLDHIDRKAWARGCGDEAYRIGQRIRSWENIQHQVFATGVAVAALATSVGLLGLVVYALYMMARSSA